MEKTKKSPGVKFKEEDNTTKKKEYIESKKIEKFFLCECSTEVMLITKWTDENEIYLSMFSYGFVHPKPNFWQRLKYAFWHIKTGKKYADSIVLSLEKAKEIGELLIKFSKEEKK